MKSIMRSVVFIILITSVLSCSKDSPEVTETNTTAGLVTNYTYNNDELEVMQLINNYRLSIGLRKLEIVNHISYKSAEHDLYMIANNVVNHNGFEDRSENIVSVLGASKVGENVAYNYKTSADVVKGWLESPGHKENIEGDYTHFGIAVKLDSNGRKYYTNIFAKI
ncbi:CAP domain-containing protein [Flavobacterium flavipigmentatum]|nr:CAP domain-containing protein [Flavobacterium sp. F-70]UFH40583.1 CAP domain-containing protein [Flavobacterium sp. F-70]